MMQYLKIAAVAAAMAVTGVAAQAATTLALGTDYSGTVLSDGSLNINFAAPELANDDFYLDYDINLGTVTQARFDPTLSGTGTLTVGFYTDPLMPSGYGSANILLDVLSQLTGINGTVTAQWGAGPIMDLSTGVAQMISTVFTSTAQTIDLVVAWDLTTDPAQQLSVNVAAVPLPAGGLLLLTGLGGLAVLRRRTKA